MNDAARRAIRTLAQWVVSGGLTALVNELIPAIKAEWLPLIQALNLILVTYVQNWLEDNTKMPALLKAPASEGENPIPEG